MIYLASPYSHPNRSVMESRFRQARLYVGVRLAGGEPVFSPIVYGHQFAEEFAFPTDANSWAKVNDDFIRSSSAVEVLMLDGWKQSIGVNYEISLAQQLGKPVRYVEPFK